MQKLLTILIFAATLIGCQPAVTHSALEIEPALEVMVWDEDANSVTYRVVGGVPDAPYHLSAYDHRGAIFYDAAHEGLSDVRVYVERVPQQNVVTFAVSAASVIDGGEVLQSVDVLVPARVE